MNLDTLWNIFSGDPRFFEVKMECRRCGRCCIGTEMELLPVDIERLLRLGYRLTHFARIDSDFVKLRCVDNHCVFFDEKTRTCKIYEHRPIGCRLYPLQLTNNDIVPDPECPAAATISKREIERLRPYVYAFVEFAKITRLWLKLRGLI